MHLMISYIQPITNVHLQIPLIISRSNNWRKIQKITIIILKNECIKQRKIWKLCENHSLKIHLIYKLSSKDLLITCLLEINHLIFLNISRLNEQSFQSSFEVDIIQEESNNPVYNDSIFLHCDQLSLNHFANNSEEIHDDEPILFEPFCKQKSQPLICV